MDLTSLKAMFARHGCRRIHIKPLAANDNSKNQVYLGGNFDILNVLPISDITASPAGDWKRERFKAALRFSWLTEEGKSCPAPRAQLILYPKYPEVRFSGFLSKCDCAPSELMRSREPGRILFLGVGLNGDIFGFAAAPESTVALEFAAISMPVVNGVFQVIDLDHSLDNRVKLLSELVRIHQLGWINSKRLDNEGNVLPCEASNCGGYTLEAELGIQPNGYSEPDYLGWEVKQFGVMSFASIRSAVITLMTPEPTGGIYKLDGAEYFIRKYGYADTSGIPDRMNFGGVHKCDVQHPRTQLRLKLIGFDIISGKIRSADGRIALLDATGTETASWSFASLLLHWNRKHDRACYVPSTVHKSEARMYQYGKDVLLGTGTDFQLFLAEMAAGRVYYDPGLKLENASTTPKVKRRSQFRVKSGDLARLYHQNETVDIIKANG